MSRTIVRIQSHIIEDMPLWKLFCAFGWRFTTAIGKVVMVLQYVTKKRDIVVEGRNSNYRIRHICWRFLEVREIWNAGTWNKQTKCKKKKLPFLKTFLCGICCNTLINNYWINPKKEKNELKYKCADNVLPALQDLFFSPKSGKWNESNSYYKIPSLDCMPCIRTNSFVRNNCYI